MVKRCFTCDKGFSKKNKGVQCSGVCRKEFHIKCASIADEVFAAIQAGNTTWRCVACPGMSNESLIISDEDDHTDEAVQEHVQGSENIPGMNLNPDWSIIKLNKYVSETLKAENMTDCLRELISAVKDIHLSQSFLNTKIDDLILQNKRMLEENKALKEKIKCTEERNIKLEKLVNNMHSQIDQVQQQKNRNNIVIAGLPQKIQNPKNTVFKIIEKIQANIEKDDVINVTRMNEHSENSKDALYLVEFKSQNNKTELLSKKKIYKHLFNTEIGFENNGNKQIFFRHHLTSLQSKLYYEAKQFKSSNEFKYLWIKEDSIFIRKSDNSKVYKIQNFNDIIFIKNHFNK